MGQIIDDKENRRGVEDVNNSSDEMSDNVRFGMGEHLIRTRSGRLLRMSSTRARLHERSRQKRQVLQDMAKPLKQWLIRHRNNPYPTKSEKVTLALGSQMTLVQVSNWFANARRRLKNTVRDPDLSWSQRIRLYNSYVSGNAEPLSISSDDSLWDSGDEENYIDECPRYHIEHEEHSYSATTPQQLENSRKRKNSESDDEHNLAKKQKSEIPNGEEYPGRETPAKYKTTILQRYLNDASKETLTRSYTAERQQSISEEDNPKEQKIENNHNWSELDAAEVLTSLSRSEDKESASLA
ncbi:homeobox protein Mohawk-like [Centruroides vittatus]|uniref:homeobox protein Mohawk-like n=1 Tax=Centruroides vittatus TaxID=120091 RepID=UPI00350F35D2